MRRVADIKSVRSAVEFVAFKAVAVRVGIVVGSHCADVKFDFDFFSAAAFGNNFGFCKIAENYMRFFYSAGGIGRGIPQLNDFLAVITSVVRNGNFKGKFSVFFKRCSARRHRRDGF